MMPCTWYGDHHRWLTHSIFEGRAVQYCRCGERRVTDATPAQERDWAKPHVSIVHVPTGHIYS